MAAPVDDAQAQAAAQRPRPRRSILWLVLSGLAVVGAAVVGLLPAEDTPFALAVVRDTFDGQSAEPTAREVVSREITNRLAWLTSPFRRHFEAELAAWVPPDAGAVETRERTVEAWSRGLSLGGGEPVRLRFAVEGQTGQTGLAEAAKAVVEKRLHALGARDARVLTVGADELVVRLPWRPPAQAARLQRVVEDLGALELRLVADETSAPFAEWERTGRETAPPGYTAYYLVIHVPGAPFRREPVLVSDAPQMSGECVQSAAVVPPEGAGLRHAVRLRFTPDGGQRLAALTGAHVGTRLAFVVNTLREADGRIADKGICVAAPVTRSRVGSGEADLVGDFTGEEAEALAATLAAGPLPAPLRLRSKTTISPPPGLFLSPLGVAAVALGAVAAVAFLAAFLLSVRKAPTPESPSL